MKLFAHKEAEEFVRSGKRILKHNRSLRLTPAARDVLIEAGVRIVYDESATAPEPAADASTAAGGGAGGDADKLFNSAQAERVKEEICDIGRRIWMREYCDGNGGNISCRIAPDAFICTPTGVSKGFLKPEMMCMVDGKGNQTAGSWKRSSEITTHLAIYHSTPEAVSVCHAHPCHAGAFAIKGLQPPARLIPELEVFVGTVAMAEYRTPGSPEMAESIKPLAPNHQSIIMGNHGVITWGKSVEDAYFKMEITDAYCRTVILAQQIPGGSSIPCEKMPELLDIKKSLGLPDDRYDLKPAELCAVDPWSVMSDHPCACATPADSAGGAGAAPAASDTELEEIVQRLTDEILKSMNG